MPLFLHRSTFFRGGFQFSFTRNTRYTKTIYVHDETLFLHRLDFGCGNCASMVSMVFPELWVSYPLDGLEFKVTAARLLLNPWPCGMHYLHGCGENVLSHLSSMLGTHHRPVTYRSILPLIQITMKFHYGSIYQLILSTYSHTYSLSMHEVSMDSKREKWRNYSEHNHPPSSTFDGKCPVHGL